MAGRRARRWTTGVVAVCLAAGAAVATRDVSAGQGQLDPVFGQSGIVRLDTGLDPAGVWVDQTLPQPDGKLLIVLRHGYGPTVQSTISRLSADGTVDPTWNNGVARHANSLVRILLQNDGKVVVISNVEIQRLDPFGQRDNSFGNLGGQPMSFRLPDFESYPIDIVSFPTGGWMLLAGLAPSPFYLAKFLPTGQLDAGFGTEGVVTLAPPTTNSKGLVVSSIGTTYVSGGRDVKAFSPTGAVVTTFGVNGVLGGVGTWFSDRCAVLDSTGRLVTLSRSTTTLSVTRFNASTGLTDLSFGSGGTVTDVLPAGPGSINCQLLRVVGDVAYLASDSSAAAMVTAVDLATGALRSTFGPGGADGSGTVSFDRSSSHDLSWTAGISADQSGVTIHVQRGDSAPDASNPQDVAIFRVNATGGSFTTFGGTGKVVVVQHRHDSVFGIARESDGETLVGYLTGSTVRVARIGPDGGPVDPAVDRTIVVRSPDAPGQNLQPLHLLVLPDSRFAVIYIGSMAFQPYALAMFHHDGTPDLNFGTGGGIAIASPLVRAGGSAQTPVLIAASLNGSALALSKIDATSGAMISSFGTSGVATLRASAAQGNDYAVDSVGRTILIRAADIGEPSTSGQAFAVVSRLTPDGHVDTSFGIAGSQTVVTPLHGRSSGLLDMTLVGSAIMIAGATDQMDLVAAKLSLSGGMDPGFGAAGVAEVSHLSGNAWPLAIVSEPTGVSFIYQWIGHPYHQAITRLRADGAMDQRVGVGGRVVLDIPRSWNVQAVTTPDGPGLLVAAAVDSPSVAGELTGEDAAVMKVTLSGPWDLQRIGGGAVATEHAVRLDLP